MKIAVIGAMIEEIEVFKNQIENCKEIIKSGVKFYDGMYHNKEVVLMLSGIGKVNAAMNTTVLFEQFNPDIVINIGTAGGMNTKLNTGDIVLSNKVIYHDVDVTGFDYPYGQVPGMPLTYESDKDLLENAESITELFDVNVYTGLIATGDSFIHRKEQINIIRENFDDVLAVEMEAGAISQVCFKYEKPFIVVRSISDIPERESQHEFHEYLELASKNSTKFLSKMIEML